MIKLTGTYRVVRVTKNTKAKMFGDINAGDMIVFELELNRVGMNGRGGTYATYIKSTNLRTGQSAGKSMNEIDPILSCFEFEQVSI